jgi:hypothetical protein
MADGGSIINVSTGLARFTLPGYGAYAAMKGGVEVLTRYLAKELGPRGITVNTLAPGAIETDFGGGVVRDNAEVNKMVASMIALGRVGKPDDIGGAVATLLAPESKWINGQRIEASGGQGLWGSRPRGRSSQPTEKRGATCLRSHMFVKCGHETPRHPAARRRPRVRRARGERAAPQRARARRALRGSDSTRRATERPATGRHPCSQLRRVARLDRDRRGADIAWRGARVYQR